jgi:hypothetical protein
MYGPDGSLAYNDHLGSLWSNVTDQQTVVWQRLREELDEGRRILNVLPEYVKLNFKIDDPRIKEALESAEGSFRRYLREVETSEAGLRDQIGITALDGVRKWPSEVFRKAKGSCDVSPGPLWRVGGLSPLKFHSIWHMLKIPLLTNLIASSDDLCRGVCPSVSYFVHIWHGKAPLLRA